MSGNFFAIGKSQWADACKLGLNPAVAFLVLARGTGRDNVTTRWSAEAVANCTGMGWRRAADAIGKLERAELAKNITEPGKRPLRKLAVPEALEDALWLPNSLVTGAANEVPPVTRLRQGQNLAHLQAFIELYGVQDLAGDHGLPRSMVRSPYPRRKHICDLGPFRVFGFSKDKECTCYCHEVGPLARFAEGGGSSGSGWDFLCALERMGLLEELDYLGEGDSPDAELIHPLTGDTLAEKVRDAAWYMCSRLPDEFQYEAEQFDYVLPVTGHITTPAVVGVWRLVYRPQTQRTGAWWAHHNESCERAKIIYEAIADGDLKWAAAI